MGTLTDVSSDTEFILCVLMFLAGLLTANLPWPWRNRRADKLSRELGEVRLENERLAGVSDGHHTEAAVAELQKLLDERTDELDRERAVREMAEEAIRRREQQLDGLKNRASSDCEELEAWKDAGHELEEKPEIALRDQHAALMTSETDQLRREREALQSLLSSQDKMRTEFESQLADLQRQLDEQCVESTQSQGELASLRVLLDKERVAKKQHEQQYAELRSQMRDKKAEHVEVLNERDSARTLLEDERRLRESMEASQRSVEQEFIRVRGELADLQSRHNDERSELERTLHQRELMVSQLTHERDTAQNALHKEQAAREGIQHLLDQRRRDIERLTGELANARADGDHRVTELKQRLRGCEVTIAQLQRDSASFKSQISAETAARQSAEHAHRELLGKSQQMSRELDKADALLEERLYLAKKLNERETRLRDLLTENESLQRELGELAGNAGSYDKESTIDRIPRLQQQTAEDDSVIDKSCRRSA